MQINRQLSEVLVAQSGINPIKLFQDFQFTVETLFINIKMTVCDDDAVRILAIVNIGFDFHVSLVQEVSRQNGRFIEMWTFHYQFQLVS